MAKKETPETTSAIFQSGYDESRFETSVGKQMICVFCSGVLNNPKGCWNDHYFCSSCISNRLLVDTTFCPTCRETLTSETLQDPPGELTRSLSKLRIHCDYQTRGCNAVVLLKDLQTHVDQCEYGPKDSADMPATSKVSAPGHDKDSDREKFEVINEKKHAIVLGGRLTSGDSLHSVQVYIFTKKRWITLPPMNVPRSCLSSALVDNEIVVSGGDTGNDVTDSIVIMKLTDTPPSWRIADATLPVPLSGHCTVVYQGKLIVIGGFDGSTGRNSNKIFEVSLVPFSWRELGELPQAISGHGAELVEGKIFIFGGGNHLGVPNNNVWMYDLATSQCSSRPPLPHAMLGMATVRLETEVILLGGVTRSQTGSELELDDVIMYDTQTGQSRNVSNMQQGRGGCSAVLIDTDLTLIAIGSLHNGDKVEYSKITSFTWYDLPNLSDARAFCTAVVSSVTSEEMDAPSSIYD